MIQKMCSLAMEKRHLSEEFYESVVERERLAKTAFGNLVAMPHPYKAQPGDPFVCVAVLEHPILWEAGEGKRERGGGSRWYSWCPWKREWEMRWRNSTTSPHA